MFSLQMSGIFEQWLYKLVSALRMREKEANVVVVDWLPLAHQLYTDAVNNIRAVGQSIARLLDRLQVPGMRGSLTVDCRCPIKISGIQIVTESSTT